MPSSKSSTLVFFVPGIMGSSLYLKEDPADIIKRTAERGGEIWGKDAGYNLGSLLKRPNLFDPDNIVPGKVIPYIDFLKFKIKIYDPLMNFCKSKDQLGLFDENNFFPFAYNWLQDNRQTAKDLATFIRKKDKKGDSDFCLIAHSMGGVIRRLMLLDEKNKDIAEKTKFLFQIATPVQGSIQTYLAIKNSPISLCYPFDRILKWCYRVKKEHILAIKKSLERCPSLYQLLPPNVTCLYDQDGTAYSALDLIVWDKNLHSYIKSAIVVHQSLAESIMPSIKIQCIYSDQHKTPIHYIVKPRNHPQKFEVIEQNSSSVKGDKTVTCASATAYSRESDNLHLIQGQLSDHLGLCHNEKVYAILKSEFNKLGKS